MGYSIWEAMMGCLSNGRFYDAFWDVFESKLGRRFGGWRYL